MSEEIKYNCFCNLFGLFFLLSPHWYLVAYDKVFILCIYMPFLCMIL